MKQPIVTYAQCAQMLASGPYAILDDGKGCILVPWRPMIEAWMEQQIAASMHQ